MNHKNLPPNSCHNCGSTSYRPIIARDEHGVMQPTGRYVCTGCKLEFTDINDWRNGPVESQVSAPTPK